MLLSFIIDVGMSVGIVGYGIDTVVGVVDTVMVMQTWYNSITSLVKLTIPII